ncbi:MAG: hypothetical protein INQ03_05795 [Candidatus Heimdallarchaeota archaeon]|nr:hypothetical protein [Candidatus Heimdallarchaeota archaeon]
MTSIFDLPFGKEIITELIMSNKNPNVISFKNTASRLLSTPVWTYFWNEQFFLFSYKDSMKVKTIEKGNIEFTLLIINRDSYPVVVKEHLPYISMRGRMEIVSSEEITNLHSIHIKLLEKYNNEDQEEWVSHLIGSISKKEKPVWMLRFTPETYFTY